MAKWTPVSEGLPEPVAGEEGKPPIISADVLCYFGPEFPVAVGNYDHDAKWWLDSFRLETWDADPTHWMPLPPTPGVQEVPRG